MLISEFRSFSVSGESRPGCEDPTNFHTSLLKTPSAHDGKLVSLVGYNHGQVKCLEAEVDLTVLTLASDSL